MFLQVAAAKITVSTLKEELERARVHASSTTTAGSEELMPVNRVQDEGVLLQIQQVKSFCAAVS